MNIDTINSITRENLIADDIEAGVTKWGESERGGLAKAAARKTDATLRAEMAARAGVDHCKAKGARIVRQGTVGSLQNGLS